MIIGKILYNLGRFAHKLALECEDIEKRNIQKKKTQKIEKPKEKCRFSRQSH